MTKSWEELYAQATEDVGKAVESYGNTIDELKEATEEEFEAKKKRKLLELERDKQKHAMSGAQSILKSMKV